MKSFRPVFRIGWRSKPHHSCSVMAQTVAAAGPGSQACYRGCARLVLLWVHLCQKQINIRKLGMEAQALWLQEQMMKPGCSSSKPKESSLLYTVWRRAALEYRYLLPPGLSRLCQDMYVSPLLLLLLKAVILLHQYYPINTQCNVQSRDLSVIFLSLREFCKAIPGLSRCT